MLKKIAIIAALASTALVAVPQDASACDQGHYEWRDQTVSEWVPARTEQYQVKVWVPGRSYYVIETQVIRSGGWQFDSCGVRVWVAPITRQVRVLKQEPGCYKLVWKTRTIPGYYRNAVRRNKVWVSDCHCHTRVYRPTPRTHSHFHGRSHGHARGTTVVVEVDGRRVGKEIVRSGRKIGREAERSGRRVGREAERSGRKVGKEAGRAGRRIGKQIKRIFK